MMEINPWGVCVYLLDHEESSLTLTLEEGDPHRECVWKGQLTSHEGREEPAKSGRRFIKLLVSFGSKSSSRRAKVRREKADRRT